jgi:hypothetical protein
VTLVMFHALLHHTKNQFIHPPFFQEGRKEGKDKYFEFICIASATGMHQWHFLVIQNAILPT